VLKLPDGNFKKPVNRIWQWTHKSKVGNLELQSIKDMERTNKNSSTEETIQVHYVKLLQGSIF
jgi:hypothetical protein